MNERPDVFRYNSATDFVRDMLKWKKENEEAFSVRRAASMVVRCSPALVSLIGRGKRSVTADRVPALARILGLNERERRALLCLAGEPVAGAVAQPAPYRGGVRAMARGNLLRPWWNLYVWEAARLRGFRPDAQFLFGLFRGIFPLQALSRSLAFLFHEGYLRRTLDGLVVGETPSVESSDEVPNQDVRALHQHALRLAATILPETPLSEREAAMVLLTLDDEGVDELKAMIKEFAEKVTHFSEERKCRGKRLYQVLINAIPLTRTQGDTSS